VSPIPRLSDSLKILIVSPYPLVPSLHGGRARTAGLAMGMARAGAEVAVLCPWSPGQPRTGRLPGGVRLRTHLLAANTLPFLLPRSLASHLALMSLQPLALGPRRLLRSFADFDVVQFEFCAQAAWMKLVPPGALVAYSAHNVEKDFFSEMASQHRLAGWSARRIERLERSAVRRSDVVVACTESDVTRLERLYGGPLRSVVVPNGCDGALLQLDRQKLRDAARAAHHLRREDRVLLFLGGNAWHNREAADFLVRQVLPSLDPSTKLLLVGKCADRYRRGNGRVLPVGYVEDLRPEMAVADLALNPVDAGSGSNVKLCDYLAAGLPVVTTPIGLRGLPVTADGIRIAGRDGFVDALTAPPPEPARDRNALNGLTWDRLGAGLLSSYERLLAR
jgi:glycosyltransferase involved in cell wall biosynthesis